MVALTFIQSMLHPTSGTLGLEMKSLVRTPGISEWDDSQSVDLDER